MVKNVWGEEDKILGAVCTEWRSESSTIVLRNCTADSVSLLSDAGTVKLFNCVIAGELNITAVDLDELIIENCVIGKLEGMSARFNGRCTITNSVFIDEFCLHASGYNKEEIRIEGNEFRCFAEFYDSVYHEPFIMTNNVFVGECDILGSKGTCVEVTFKNGYKIEGNIGNLHYDSVIAS